MTDEEKNPIQPESTVDYTEGDNLIFCSTGDVEFEVEKIEMNHRGLTADEIDVVYTIDDFVVACHEAAKEKGFWDEPDYNTAGVKIALIHSEASELLEEYREGGSQDKKAEELADLLIRAFDFAGGFGLDLGRAVIEKMRKNCDRPRKHNKEF